MSSSDEVGIKSCTSIGEVPLFRSWSLVMQFVDDELHSKRTAKEVANKWRPMN